MPPREARIAVQLEKAADLTQYSAMTEEELIAIIRKAGGKIWAQRYAGELLKKISRLEKVGKYQTLLAQLSSASEQGDLRGRALEVNFAYAFIEKNFELQYGARQGRSGDIDFCWRINSNNVFIELKLLRQHSEIQKSTAKQLKDTGFFSIVIDDETRDIGRIQRDILSKASTKKFKSDPEKDWINLVAIDVSELQLGTIDITDCLLAVYGNSGIVNGSSAVNQDSAIVGIFESLDEKLTPDQSAWIERYHDVSDVAVAHPRTYIHGVVFLFRDPVETAALSYSLRSLVVWNRYLIDPESIDKVEEIFYQLLPKAPI